MELVVSEIDVVRERGILSSRAGSPFLLAFGVAWIVAGALSYVVPRPGGVARFPGPPRLGRRGSAPRPSPVRATGTC